jgi:hypothetical protein
MLSLYRRGAPLHRASAPLFDPLRHGLVVTSSVGELRTRAPKPAAVSTRGSARGAQLARGEFGDKCCLNIPGTRR